MNYILLVAAIVVIAVVKVLMNYSKNVYNYWKKRGVNGPVPLPIFGNFIAGLTKPNNELEEERLIKYGRVYGTFEFSKPVLTIADPKLIREVAVKHFHNFQNRWNRMSEDEFLAKTLFFKTDDDWKTLRSCLSPVFTSKKMKNMLFYVDQCAENTLQYIESLGKKEVAAKVLTLSFTMDAIAKCAFGVDTNGYTDPNNDFLIKARETTKLSYWRLFLAFVVPKKIQKLHKSLAFSPFDYNLLRYLKDVLLSIIEQRKNIETEANDFVSLVLSLEAQEEADDTKDANDIFGGNTEEVLNPLNSVNKSEKKKLDNEEILSQSFMFLFAGYETTSTLLNFTLYSLATNPDVQQKLYNEIIEYNGSEDKIVFETIHSMPYLDAVINEGLRMYTPIVVLDRIAAEDIVLGEQKIKIEKGTVVNLPFYGIHYDPQFFPEPHKFKPERFLPENKHLIEPYTFIPFGVGPRMCLGLRFAIMTSKSFLVKLLKRFEVVKTEKTPTMPNYKISYAVLSSSPLYVAFAARE